MDTLWQRAARVSRSALETGALKPIETESFTLSEDGVDFSVRVLSSLRHKAEAQRRLAQAGDHGHNPFLPPDPALLVAEIPPAHRCVLNKFCVIERHLLLVTRDFEPQSQALNSRDFHALAHCLRQGPALAFFNGGPDAGASQPHKHLQLIPLDRTDAPPFSSLLDRAAAQGLSEVPELRFRHTLAALPEGLLEDVDAAADWLLRQYRRSLDMLGLDVTQDGTLSGAYNLLLTQRWMLTVPRSRESSEDISINALGFAGWLLVKQPAQVERLKARGLMRTLQAVAGPAR